MKRLTRVVAMCAVAVGLLTAVAGPALAETEPTNNTYPWANGPAPWNPFHGNMSVFSTTSTNTGWGYPESISPSGDVDYFLMACGRIPGGTGIIKEIWTHFTHATGDLDLAVYTVDGVFVGSSAGVTDDERINVAAQNMNALVLKVYGYNGATNPYSLNLVCQ